MADTAKAVLGNNAYAPGDYQGYSVSYGIIRANIQFNDETKAGERVAWFQQILSEHGCRLLKLDKKQTQTGNFFNRKKWLSVTAEIEGRGFVVKSIRNYYGGTLAGNPDGYTASNDPAVRGLVALELQNRTAELAILRFSFEVDKLIVERSKLGLLDFSAKSRIDKALKELKEVGIPGEKAKIAGNNAQIRSGFADLAQKAIEAQDYQRAIDLIGASRDNSQNATFQVGNCYLGLKQYDKAIAQFSALTGSSAYGEKAELGIADSQHLKGDDREAMNSIYRVLGNFRNSPEELAALAKVDDWKLLDRAKEFPEMSANISGVYVQKGLIDAGPARSTAVTDYQRGVEFKAAGGSKAEASKKILSEYSAVKTRYRSQLGTAKQVADQNFNMKRERARGQYEAWQTSYTRAQTNARYDYDTDLRDKRREYDDAKRELDYLTRNPPAAPGSGSQTGGTDPYSNNPSTGGTDPYSTKPKTGGTDPYGIGGATAGGTDPYSTKPKTSGTDPYGIGGATAGGTDPYSGGSGNSGNAGTDPYNDGEYQNRLDSARAKVDRLNREYSWLYYNEESYVSDKTSSERASLETAKNEYERFDSANKPAYIANDSEVQRYSGLYSQADQKYVTLKGLAQEAGY